MSSVVHLYFGVLDQGRAVTAKVCGRYSSDNTRGTASIENCTCRNCLNKLLKSNLPREIKEMIRARLRGSLR
jgi:hypothetical protein